MTYVSGTSSDGAGAGGSGGTLSWPVAENMYNSAKKNETFRPETGPEFFPLDQETKLFSASVF